MSVTRNTPSGTPDMALPKTSAVYEVPGPWLAGESDRVVSPTSRRQFERCLDDILAYTIVFMLNMCTIEWAILQLCAREVTTTYL